MSRRCNNTGPALVGRARLRAPMPLKIMEFASFEISG